METEIWKQKALKLKNFFTFHQPVFATTGGGMAFAPMKKEGGKRPSGGYGLDNRGRDTAEH